jgi:hypothetical protein
MRTIVMSVLALAVFSVNLVGCRKVADPTLAEPAPIDPKPTEPNTETVLQLKTIKTDSTSDKVRIVCRYGYSDRTWDKIERDGYQWTLPEHEKEDYPAHMIFFDADKKELTTVRQGGFLGISHDFSEQKTQFTDDFIVSAERPPNSKYASVRVVGMNTRLIPLE